MNDNALNWEKEPYHNQDIVEMNVRDSLQIYFTALRLKNIDVIMDLYAEDIVAFDLNPPFRLIGKKSYRKVWQKNLINIASPNFVAKELRIKASDKIAFCLALMHLAYQSRRKERKIILRWTACMEQFSGRWLFTHEHFSVPVDAKSGLGVFSAGDLAA